MLQRLLHCTACYSYYVQHAMMHHEQVAFFGTSLLQLLACMALAGCVPPEECHLRLMLCFCCCCVCVCCFLQCVLRVVELCRCACQNAMLEPSQTALWQNAQSEYADALLLMLLLLLHEVTCTFLLLMLLLLLHEVTCTFLLLMLLLPNEYSWCPAVTAALHKCLQPAGSSVRPMQLQRMS
jgi:hypothetical protein